MDKNEEKQIPIMKVKPIFNSNRGMIKCVGYIKNEKELGDELIEIDTDEKIKNEYGTNLIFISKHNSYNILAKIYSCNVIYSYLQQNRKVPVFYMTVIYERKFVSGFLLSYYVYFELDTQPQKILNSELYGKYTLEFVSDKDYLDKIITFATPKIRENLMIDYVNELDNSNISFDDETLIKAKNIINSKLEKKINLFRKLFEPVELNPYMSKHVVIEKHMKVLCSNSLFIEFVNYGVDLRDSERKTENFNGSFKIPKRIFDIKKIKNDPSLVDKMFEDNNDRTSDDTDYEN